MEGSYYQPQDGFWWILPSSATIVCSSFTHKVILNLPCKVCYIFIYFFKHSASLHWTRQLINKKIIIIRSLLIRVTDSCELFVLLSVDLINTNEQFWHSHNLWCSIKTFALHTKDFRVQILFPLLIALDCIVLVFMFVYNKVNTEWVNQMWGTCIKRLFIMEIKSPVLYQLLALIKKSEKYSKLGLVPNSDCLQLHNKTEVKAAIIAMFNEW